MKRSQKRILTRLFICSAALLLFSLIPPASAEELKGKPLRYEISDSLTLELPGYYRFRFTHLTPMTLSIIPTGARKGESESVGEIDYTEHRLRINPKVTFFKKLEFISQIDVLSGMLSGNTDGRPYMWFARPEKRWNDIDGTDVSHFQSVHLRRYYGSWESPVGLFRVGRQGSTWGLGLVANDGNGFTNDFGDAYYGDTVDRVLFGTKPYSILQYLLTGEKPVKDPVTVAFAYDWNVARDNLVKTKLDKQDLENAVTPQGNRIDLFDENLRDDEAHQYVGAIRVETEPFEGGLYIVRRHMEHFDALLPAKNRPDEEYLNVWVLDVYGKLHLKPGWLDGGEIFIEGELTRIFGKTNLTVSRILAGPDDQFPESTVSQLGWVVRGGVRHSWIETKLETGYASGDSNPFDDEVRNFKFHPDYNVGMILFDDLLAGVSNTSAFNSVFVFDEGGNVRTLGADLLPSNGSVTNAVYINPTVKVTPMDGLDAIVGVLWARTATDFVDPSIDFLYGGAWGQFNPLGAPSSNNELGWEVDVGVRYKWDKPFWDLILGLQYGHFFPGDVFEDADGNRMDDIDKVQGRFTFIW